MNTTLKHFCLLILIIQFSTPTKILSQDNTNLNLSNDYIKITMSVLDNKLIGEFEGFPGFILTMILPDRYIDKNLQKPDIIKLVKENKIEGELIYPVNSGSKYAGQSTKVKYEVVNYRNIDDIFMKCTLGYFLWEYLTVKNGKVNVYINWWYHPPASEVDLRILNQVKLLISSPDKWDRDDDRKCESDITNNVWSLFCALKYSSIEQMGEYNHHNTAIQTVRFVIDDLIPDHGFSHTLMDYNNLSTTTHKDILMVVDLAIEIINKELKTKSSSVK